jgi:hypothetical protein
MAREVIEKLIDDLDGGDATETVSFGLDGTPYEVDLNKRNAAALRKVLDRYIKAARRASTSAGAPRRKPAPTGRAATSTTRDYDIVALREWAGTNGIAVPSRGRIPQVVVEQYRSAGTP